MGQGCFLEEIVAGLYFDREARADRKRRDFRQREEFVQRPGAFKPALSSGSCFVVLDAFSWVFSCHSFLPGLYLYLASYST